MSSPQFNVALRVHSEGIRGAQVRIVRVFQSTVCGYELIEMATYMSRSEA